MTFTIITDSASDIEPEFQESEDIRVVPTKFIFGSEEYRDTEMAREDFLNRLVSGEIATTSQPSPADFETVYLQALKDNPSKEILSIHISSKLSGTYQTGYGVISNLEEGRCEIFDTMNVTLGSGYFVYLAAYLRSKKYNLDQVLEILTKARDKVNLQIFIEGTDYLHRSGRINLTKYLILKNFRLRPLISCKDGKLVTSGLAFGKKGALKKIVKKIKSYDAGPSPVLIYGHATTPEIIDELRERTKSLNPSMTASITICNTLLSHTGVGPFGIGIAPSFDYFVKNSDKTV